MAKQITGIKGEFRRLNPIEVGAIVLAAREQRQLKRISLAEPAHLSEKTLERIEGGKAAGSSSYRGIANVLGLAAELFIRHQYVPTETEVRDSVDRYAAQVQHENEEVPVQAITDPRDVLTILEADAFLLQRLDASLGKALADNTVVDEVLPEIKRRRKP